MKDNHGNKISSKVQKTMNEQLSNCICRINGGSGILGTGFFTKIPVHETEGTKILSVLITSNHFVNEEYIRKEKKLKIIFGNNAIKYINID